MGHRPNQNAPGERRRGTPLLILLTAAVCAAVLAVHWPALSREALAFDDDIYFTDNHLVQNPSWANAGRFLSEVLEPSTVRGYYQPLTMISLMADCALGAGVDNLRPLHRTSLALHVANTALVIVLIYLLFGRAWPAAVVGLIFGVHPLTVEPIPWVGERKTLLAAFFALISLVAYVRFARRRGLVGYGACLLAFCLALMAKPTSTPLPVLMLLLDYWPLGRLHLRGTINAGNGPRGLKPAARVVWRLVWEKVPLLTLAGVSAVITYVSQARTAVAALPGDYSPARIPLTICHNIVFYLHKMIWPSHLSAHYPFPDPFTLGHPAVLIGIVGTVVLLAGLLWSLRYTRALATGWLIFFIAIFPTLGVIGFTNVIASDKYAYLPAVGLLITLGWVVGHFWTTRRSDTGRLAVLGALSIVALAESVATRSYYVHWKDTHSFGRRIVAMAPGSFEARIHYALTLARASDVDGALGELNRALELEPRYWKTHYNLAVLLARQGYSDRAFEHYAEALRQNPREPEVYTNMGGMLLQKGRVEEAAEHFRRAVELEPEHVEAHNNLGAVLLSQQRIGEAIHHLGEALRVEPDNHKAHTSLGQALARQDRFDEAVSHFTRAIEIAPDYLDVRLRFGEALSKQGKADEAIAQYRQAVRIDPDLLLARIRLATAFAGKNMVAEAIEQYGEALRINPNHAAAHHDLGIMGVRQGRFADAAAHFQDSLRLNPEFVKGYNNLGLALMRLGDPLEAIDAYRQAVRLDPRFVSAHINLGNALRVLGRFDEAITACRRAVELDPDNAAAHFTLGLTLEDVGKLDEAASEYRETMRLNPKHPHAWERLISALGERP